MNDTTYSRRRFMLLSSALPSASLAVVPNLSWLLHSRLGEDKIFTLLSRHLQLEPQHRSLVSEFYASLLTQKHREKTPALTRLLLDEQHTDQLEKYLLEEFITTTNYLAVQDGLATGLRFEGIPT